MHDGNLLIIDFHLIAYNCPQAAFDFTHQFVDNFPKKFLYVAQNESGPTSAEDWSAR
jgi:hypothetical protein